MNISSSYDQEQQSIFHFDETRIDHECDQCLKLFACEYGLHHHRNMYHPNQSIFCTNCNLTFRSHRALKNHQQRFHFIHPGYLPNYNHISSYLVLPFSTQQFPLTATTACEHGRFPLGALTSTLFQCQLCSLSFPTSNALKHHQLHQHEQYQYDLCQKMLYEIVLQVEENFRAADDEIQSMKFLLAKQASHFGLMDRKLAQESRAMKHAHHRQIFPTCEHENRTCANLCLKDLSSYYKLIQNYPYQIPTVPKGNPFAQGSIVSKTSILSKESSDNNQKRSPIKRVRSSPLVKRKLPEQSIIPSDQSFIFPKKSLLKNHSYTRSVSSMSSTSSTSTRSSSRQSLKRSISPIIALAVERSSEKRRRQRERRQANTSSTVIKILDDIEQENDDDEIIAIESKKPKQRQASNSSVEYVQVINNDQSSISSLNNIENLKLKSPSNEEDIIVYHPSQKTPSKTSNNGGYQIKTHQTSEYDEKVRVRCKICGDILDGRSRFSQHVLTMHSHLIKSNLSQITQQQTTVVYSV